MLETVGAQRVHDVDVRVDAALLALERENDDGDVDQGADQTEAVTEHEQQNQRGDRGSQQELLPPRAEPRDAKHAETRREVAEHGYAPERIDNPRRAIAQRP